MKRLRFIIIRDLIADARAFAVGAPPDWAERCREDIRLIFPQRHAMPLDAFGWPVDLRERHHNPASQDR